MPDTIQFRNGNQIVNKYDAGGRKLASLHYTLLYTLPAPLTEGEVLQLYFDMDFVDETGTFHVDNIEYDFNGCDREVWCANNATTLQRTHYYPSGLPWNTNTGIGSGVQNRKYNDKEFVEMHGLDEYDSEARWYYPAIMRTTTMDPHCENYYDTSPFAWCANNPARIVDPDGRDWYSYQEEYTDENGKKQTRTQYKYVERQMTKKEMENGGYTHLGKTYTNGNEYYSLFGRKADLSTEIGKIYQKVDEAIINYAKSEIDKRNIDKTYDSLNSEDVVYNGNTNFSIPEITGRKNISYEGSVYGLYINFTGKGMNIASMVNWIGDSDMPMDIGPFIGSKKASPQYHIRFQNNRRGDTVHLKYNEREAKIILRKFYNLFPTLKPKNDHQTKHIDNFAFISIYNCKQ